jgi:hypothetical protein
MPGVLGIRVENGGWAAAESPVGRGRLVNHASRAVFDRMYRIYGMYRIG